MNSSLSWLLFPYLIRKVQGKIGTVPIIVRTAQLSDVKGAADVLTLSFHPTPKFLAWLYPILRLGVYEDLRSRLRSSSPNYKCLVACRKSMISTIEKEEIIGTVEISLRSSWFFGHHTAYISNLAVSPTSRRQGVAEKLLCKCEQIATEWGFEEIFLHVLEDNEPARQLYLKNGYELQRIDSSLGNWLFGSPRRLLLNKELSNSTFNNLTNPF